MTFEQEINPMPVSLDDSDLPSRIRARDPQAIKAVVKAYMGQVLRAARGAGLDENLAEDVVQATFLTFMEKAENFEGKSHVRTWIFGILYKKILEAHRETKRDQKKDSIEDVMEERFKADGSWMRPPEHVDMQVEDSEVREKIMDCLDGVPGKQRIAFILKEIEGHSSKEICKIMNVTRTNLGALLFRCRNRLRECLERKGVKRS